MAEMVEQEGEEMTTYIGHARMNSDRKAGDSSGKEVCITKFTYSSSSTSVYNWTYVFRPKKHAEMMAWDCERACANNKIGYSSHGTSEYGKNAIQYLAKEVGYDLGKIKTKTGVSCGDLICLCSRYAGLSTCFIGSGRELAKNLSNNKNYTKLIYKRKMKLKRGDVLITAHSNGKNNHVVMCLGESYGKRYPKLPKRGYFKKGDKGLNVKRLQRLLKWAGFDCGKVDGEIGEKTESAIKEFKQHYKLSSSGRFGRKALAQAERIRK